MKLCTAIMFDGDAERLARHVVNLEAAGVDMVLIPEIYGFDQVSVLGYIAAKTSTIELMTGIVNVYSRSPALIAQSAATIDALSGGRFTLGIGTSGAQVVEGWHGVPFKRPLGRTRDTVDICRKVWSGDKVTHDGKAVSLPLPADEGTGLGKPLKFMNRIANKDIPIVIASIGPSNVQMTAEIADGWQPIHFVPDRFDRVWGEALEAGRALRNPDLGPMSIFGDANLAIGEGEDVATSREMARGHVGFYVGGMGAKSKNYYNDLFKRYGWEEEAEKIQDLFLGGQRAEAMAAVPDEYVDSANLIGTETHIKERLAVYKDVGVTHLTVAATGSNAMDDLSAVKAWIE
ncbi:MAG: F420-dependent oxidoreductase-like protein [Candidatus Aldehydirespiratoraceae bacterium]|jgi:F420-dependent oxidoreductase-like protein